MVDELKVFTGNAHPALAQGICEYLGIHLGKAEVTEFPNENIFVRLQESVRERDVFVVQPICSPVNKSMMERMDSFPCQDNGILRFFAAMSTGKRIVASIMGVVLILLTIIGVSLGIVDFFKH